jgi:hypothetical protein
MTNEELTTIKARSTKAGGPCEYDGTGMIFRAGSAEHVAYISNQQSGERGRDVTKFVAAVFKDVPDLVAEVERLNVARAGDQHRLFHYEAVLSARWLTMDSYTPTSGPFSYSDDVLLMVEGRRHLGAWYQANEREGWWTVACVRVTHWMPLPIVPDRSPGRMWEWVSDAADAHEDVRCLRCGLVQRYPVDLVERRMCATCDAPKE